MKKFTFLFAIIAICIQTACLSSNDKNKEARSIAQIELAPIQVPLENGYARAYFASGCFWCVEAIYESVKGVKESISGYSGGHTENPTYESSNTGRTGHAEAVEIIYNPEVISFEQLVVVYFGSQNIIFAMFAHLNDKTGPLYSSIGIINSLTFFHAHHQYHYS